MEKVRKNIGLIGLGLMGQGLAKRLVGCGHHVTGFDRISEKIDIAKANGVHPATSAASVTDVSDIVHICVMTKVDLETAVFGADGIATKGTSDKILIDHSTTPVETTKALAGRLEFETGMGWIDAPVSGGPPAAEAGTLAIMAGGSPNHIEQAFSILADLGKATHMGPLGAGQATKMVNQVIVLNNFCVLAEALALAEAGGVEAMKIPTALGQGYAGSNMLQKLLPRMIERDFRPTGYLFQCMKDLDMVHDFAKSLSAPTPMSNQATSLFRIMMSKGHGDLDAISVLKLYDGKETV